MEEERTNEMPRPRGERRAAAPVRRDGMREQRPRSEQESLDISGAGAYKLRKYGKAFLRRIAQFR